MGSVTWKGFSRAELALIEAPVLIVVCDRDFVRVEHTLESSKLMPNAELAVIPDAGHFVLSPNPNGSSRSSSTSWKSRRTDSRWRPQEYATIPAKQMNGR